MQDNALNQQEYITANVAGHNAKSRHVDRSDIYRVIEKFTLGNIKNQDVVKALKDIDAENISTTYAKSRITISFTGYDGRNYVMQARSESGITPIATYEATSMGNQYESSIFVSEAVDKDKDKAMSKAYSSVIYEPLQHLFEKLFGYKPDVISNGHALGGRIYGETIGTSDLKPNITNYIAYKDSKGDWHVKYEAVIKFTYDTGVWRAPSAGDIYEDTERNIWKYREDGFWYLMYENNSDSKKQNSISPSTRPYLLSELTSNLYT